MNFKLPLSFTLLLFSILTGCETTQQSSGPVMQLVRLTAASSERIEYQITPGGGAVVLSGDRSAKSQRVSLPPGQPEVWSDGLVRVRLTPDRLLILPQGSAQVRLEPVLADLIQNGSEVAIGTIAYDSDFVPQTLMLKIERR